MISVCPCWIDTKQSRLPLVLRITDCYLETALKQKSVHNPAQSRFMIFKIFVCPELQGTLVKISGYFLTHISFSDHGTGAGIVPELGLNRTSIFICDFTV